MAKIIGTSFAELEEAAAALAAGRLVALPTETVYGLGGSALMDSAAKKIYAVKGRPATDPLICHVDRLEKAVELWDPAWDSEAIALASAIGEALWPGPLTIVCKANPSLPPSVTGGSGFVGARIPRHPVALELLRIANIPIAAPSANTFGHVSPTTAQHVYDDLASRDPELLIIDGGSCEVGIESTVIKVNNVGYIEILRRGQVSVSDIQHAIAVSYPQTRIEIRDTRSRFKVADQPMDGPGQLLTHYSPGVPASLITPASVEGVGSSSGEHILVVRGEARYTMQKTVIIDYKSILGQFKERCLAYRDLSERGMASDACSDVFKALRWSEHVDGAEDVIFPFLSEWDQEGVPDLLAAVEDRLFRAASGVTALLLPE